MSQTIRVNDFAPRDGKLSFFIKKVGEHKSDGFALILDDLVFVIDAGRNDDRGMITFLEDLRAKWLSGQNPDLLEDENARLELCVIASHPHPDHTSAMAHFLCDPRFCVVSFYAPERSYLSLDVPGALEKLTIYENRLDLFTEHLTTYHHTVRQINRLPFGQRLTVPAKGMKIELFAAPFDWSSDRNSETEGIGFLKRYLSPTYADCPEWGYSNGALNGNSLWVKITKGNHRILITGDQRASDEMLGSMIRHHGKEHFACDVLKLPHHGEKNFCPDLIEAAAPQCVIFTASEGYTTPETEDLCKEKGIPCLYANKGDLVITLDGESIQIN